jgi:hypothetical protein
MYYWGFSPRKIKDGVAFLLSTTFSFLLFPYNFFLSLKEGVGKQNEVKNKSS